MATIGMNLWRGERAEGGARGSVAELDRWQDTEVEPGVGR